MNKVLTVGLLSAALSACVGPVGTGSSSSDAQSSDNGQPSSSSVTTVSSSSVTVVSSSSVAPISSSSAAPISSSSVASSSAPAFGGNAALGKAAFETNCAGCHSDSDNDGYFGGSGDDKKIGSVDPDALGTPNMFGAYNGNSVVALAGFIAASMAPASCNSACVDNTAAYIWSLRDGQAGESAVAASCTNPNDVHYGKRMLSVLTSYEYHNSLSKLFALPLPADYSSPAKVTPAAEVARLPNNSITSLDGNRLNEFYDNASEIVDWVIATPAALPFSCDDPVSCANDFITEFAYVAYRRALTDEEQTEITSIFEGAPNMESGLRWALTTVLMSPNFLYRSELGTQVSELLANPVVAPGTDYDFQGTPTSFEDLSITPYQRLTVGGNDLRYTWTGNDLVAISVRGQQNSRTGDWPTLTIGANTNGSNDVIAQISVDHTGFRTHYLTIDQSVGSVYFLHDANIGNNYDFAPLEVASLTVGVLGQSEPVEDDVEKLMAADQTAYALDPYEYASALSFALTGSGPSKSLLDAAVAGELVDAASREAHVDALIDSDLGREHVARLAGKWFRTDGLPSKTRNVDEFTPEVRDSMMQEIREMYTHVFYNGDFPSIYAGDFTFLDSTLAAFYGMNGQGGSSHGDFRYVDTTGTRRGGVIASGAFMAYNAHMDYSSPIQRSAHFRQDVLCQAIPLPTNLEDTQERMEAEAFAKQQLAEGSLTTEKWYDIQTNIPGASCATCHNALINPLFGMDDFDNVGRLRPIVNGQVVQNSLTLVVPEGGDPNNPIVLPQGSPNASVEAVNNGSFLYAYDAVGTLSYQEADAAKEVGDGLPFSGAKSLGKVIVENELPGIGECLIEKTARYALGFSLDRAYLDPAETGFYGITEAQASELACLHSEAAAAYNQSKSPRDVLKAIVMSDAFRFRK